ncbi:hypothetical protein HAX54_051368, partial [Datura stramonium]|nr:hypothetical protein [Datura stramonium]
MKAPTHGFPDHIFLEKFYTGLDPLTQFMANNAAGGYFMNETYNRISIILDQIAMHNQAWHSGDQSRGLNM